jgi:hypothetical protein
MVERFGRMGYVQIYGGGVDFYAQTRVSVIYLWQAFSSSLATIAGF